MQVISVGVRDFAVPVPKTGNIDLHSGYGFLPRSNQEVHNKYLSERKRLLKSQGRSYKTEVKIQSVFQKARYSLKICGRVDGLIEEQPLILEEVKTDFNTALLRQHLENKADHPYCLQLKMYGYMHYRETGALPALQLILVSMRDFDWVSLPVSIDLDSFERWLEARLEEVVAEYEQEKSIARKRRALVDRLLFPFGSARHGQEELMFEVEECVEQGERLLVQAPTGLGKTIAVLYPAMKSAFRRGAQLIYVTPKNSQHAIARDAIERLRRQNRKLKMLVLTAKSKLCMKEEVFCNPDYCQYARNYYDKLNENDVISKVARAGVLDRSRFVRFARKYEVCPFELSLDTLKHADVVIGDYNYVFSPFNIMGRFSSSLIDDQERPDLVIDEAHNLPGRAAGYYSAALSISDLKLIQDNLEKLPPHVAFKTRLMLDEAISIISSYQALPGGLLSPPFNESAFSDLLARVRTLANEHLGETIVLSRGNPLFNFLQLLETFVNALSHQGDEFVMLFDNRRGGTLKIVCCDPSKMLEDSYDSVRSVVAFSATLKPFAYYRDLMGLDDKKLRLKEFLSPFPEHNRKILVIPQISTKYSDRARNYSKIAEAIKRITAVKSGNYIVFFPSFDFLYNVSSLLNPEGFSLLLQQRDMSAAAIDEYLTALKTQRGVILCAVQGGVFAEGVDYPGDMLIGAIIVGPALPTYDNERRAQLKYFEQKYGDGEAYAYVYPAMAKVVQSAGRVIRSPDDKGLIVLLGKRFLEKDYAQSMPRDWYNNSVNELVSDSILRDVSKFWDKEPGLSDSA